MISVILSTSAATTGADVGAFAQHVEQLGLHGVFVGDHLAAYRPILESTLTLAMIAARTTRIHVGFGVMVVALRNPAWAAKQVATLQQLSGNRVILGVGSGGDAHGTAAWQAVRVPYGARGKRTDLVLDVLPRLIGGQAVRLESGAEIALAPRAEVPPIWVGGGTAISLRRTIQYGDAWFPSMIAPDDVASGARRLSELASERGQPVPSIAVGGSVLLGSDAPSSALDAHTAALTRYGVPPEKASHLPITGSPRQAADRLAEYAAAGASHFVLGLLGSDWHRQCELLAETQQLMTTTKS